MERIMGGWKTWMAIAAATTAAAERFANGDIQAGAALVIAALGALGLGSKIDQAKRIIIAAAEAMKDKK